MRSKIAAAAAVTLLIGGAALADPFSNAITHDAIAHNPMTQPDQRPGTTGLQVGIGVICNTPAQAESFVTLRARGTETMMAVNGVNKQVRDPKACGLAAIAYKRGKTLTSKSLNGKLMDIVRIDVLAGYDGHGWARVPEMTQYAIMQSPGVAI